MPSDATILTGLPVVGALPDALSGQYLVAGAGTVHSIRLGGRGAASYRSRRIDPEIAPTSVIAFGNSVLAFSEGALAYELDDGLGALRNVDLAGARRMLGAPPRIDPRTGELHLLTDATGPSQLHVTVSRGGLRRTIRPIDDAPSRIRQLEPTRDDVVLLADGFVGVADRAGANSHTTWFPVDTDARNVASAHTHGDCVVVYTTGPSLARWTLRRHDKTFECLALDAAPHAGATSNPRPPDAVCRFLWTVGTGAAHQHDLLTGSRRSHDFGSGREPGALVFVADPDRSPTEDGGWLLGFVHDEGRNEADFVVLDAEAIERRAVAVVRVPRRVPLRARGTWIPAVPI